MVDASPIVDGCEPSTAGPGIRRSPEERAVGVAIACSIAGALVKFVAGALTGSMSLLASGVDSLGDLFVSISNLFVVRYADLPPDEEHNYGHARIEGFGSMFEGGFVFAAGTFIIYESIHRAVFGRPSHDSSVGILVMIPVLAMTVGTVLHLRKVARRTGSLVLKADALHYLSDVWVSLGVLVSLVLVRITGLPVVDTIVSIAIALFMMASSFGIMKDGFDVQMDRSLDPATVRRVRQLVASSARVASVHDFKTSAGKIPHVDFHVVVEPGMTVVEVHDLFLDLRAGVRSIVGPSTRVLMHADPAPVGA